MDDLSIIYGYMHNSWTHMHAHKLTKELFDNKLKFWCWKVFVKIYKISNCIKAEYIIFLWWKVVIHKRSHFILLYLWVFTRNINKLHKFLYFRYSFHHLKEERSKGYRFLFKKIIINYKYKNNNTSNIWLE